MKTILQSLFFFFFLPTFLNAQTLNPSLGLAELPDDDAPICDWETYLGAGGGFNVSGLHPGETATDFTLYELDGTAHNLLEDLQTGKPVLLIAGSYTCPVFRNRVSQINEVVATYKEELIVYVVYVNEAHPWGDPGPYHGTMVGYADYPYAQHTTYGERKEVLEIMLDDLKIDATIIIDGPCNEWQMVYGPAPQNATLIAPDGTVFAKHAWFNKAPFFNIFDDVDALLGQIVVDPPNQYDGTFEFQLDEDSLVTGAPSETMTVKAILTNDSEEDVIVFIDREENNLPDGWTSSLCTDVCLPPDTDTTTLFIAAGESQSYTMYFYSNDEPGEGEIKMVFTNLNDPQNTHTQWFYGSTESVNTTDELLIFESITVFPNPIYDDFFVKMDLSKPSPVALQIHDYQGKTLWTQHLGNLAIGQHQISIRDVPLAAGSYFLKVETDYGVISKQLFVQK